MTVLCKNCDSVCAETRKQSPERWCCIKAPRPLLQPLHLRFVDPDWSPGPPYERCSVMNPNGNCEHFTPLRGAKE